MRTRPPLSGISTLVLLRLLIVGLGGCAASHTGAASAYTPPIRVAQREYKGWADAWTLSNDACELVVVPSVSRAMSFRLTGGPNLLWEDPKLAGKTFPVDPREWQNVGGEKLWPTQQSFFGRFTGLGGDWPPPWPWDAGASKAEAIPGGVRLTLPHDPRFGAHAVREFTLDPKDAIVHVRQWIEKTEGEPAPFTLWTVMQVNDPTLAFAPAPDGGHTLMGPASPQIANPPGHVTLGRDQKQGLKVGVPPQGQNGYVAALFAQAGGKPAQLLVHSHRLTDGATYPDKGLQAELYTSPVDFARYTELELLGPLVTLKPGERLRDDRVWQIVTLDEQADPLRAAADRHVAALEVLKE